VAPAPGVASQALRVKRNEQPQLLELALPLAAANAPASGTSDVTFDARALRLGVAICFLLIVVLFATPLPSPTPPIARALSALASLHAVRPSAAQLIAGPPLVLAALAVASEWPLPAWLALAACLAAAVPLLLARERSRGALLAAAGHAGVLSALLACVCASSGTSELSGIVRQQGVAPFAWKAFTHPELGLGCMLFVAHAAKLLPASTTASRRVTRAWTACVTLGLSLLAACCFFGGHVVAASAPDPFWIGSAWLCAKALGVACAVTVARRMHERAVLSPQPLARAAVKRTLLALGAVGMGTALSVWLAPSRDFEQAMGAIVGTTALCTLVLSAFEGRRLLAPPHAGFSDGFRPALPESD
jgi:hypothetical protein